MDFVKVIGCISSNANQCKRLTDQPDPLTSYGQKNVSSIPSQK